jgi:hypothetical protein
VVNLVDGAYDNVRYFPVSAMGHKAVTGQAYKPWGVMDPVMWLLSYTKSSFKKIVTWLQTNTYPKVYLNIKKFIIRILVLALVGVILYNFIWPIQLILVFLAGFIKTNLVSVLVILGICIICVLLCLNAQEKSKIPELKLLLNVLFSIGLIFFVINFNTIKNTDILGKMRLATSSLFTKKAKPAIIQNRSSAMYAYVVPYRLNVRSRPSDSGDIIGVLEEKSRIEIVDNSGIWWRIRFRDIEGYVYSDLLRRE